MSAPGHAPRLVCDLDGTLADSAPSLCAAGNRVLAHVLATHLVAQLRA